MKDQKLGSFLKNENKGIILMDTLIAISMFSVIIIILLSLLNSVNSIGKNILRRSKTIKDINHTMEFIVLEIHHSDDIYYTNEISGFNDKFKNNIGFIIKTNKNSKDKFTNYISYDIKNNKIRRIAANTKTNKIPNTSEFQGYNTLTEKVSSFEGTKIKLESGYIDLSIVMEYENLCKNRLVFLNHQVKTYE